MRDLPVGVVERLSRDERAWLTTLRPDGSPHVTPVWFLVHEGTWWVCSAARNAKVRHVVGDPRVALALEDGRAPVVAEGTVAVHREAFPAEVVAGFARKYAGWDITAPGVEGPRVLLEVTVSRWLLVGEAQ